MENLIGTKVPQVTFKTRAPKEGMNPNVCNAIEAEWKDVSTAEMFDGKKVIVFEQQQWSQLIGDQLLDTLRHAQR